MSKDAAAYVPVPAPARAGSQGGLTKRFSRVGSVKGGRWSAEIDSLEARERYPHEDHAELDGKLKAFVFGFNDGLCANTSLILGMAFASSAHSQLIAATGFVGLCAGAASMAAGEWVSGTLANAAERAEKIKELQHHRTHGAQEDAHFADEMRELGFSDDTIRLMQTDMQSNPATKLKVHCKVELGLDDAWDETTREVSRGGGSTDTALSTIAMAVAFSVGAVIPLLPWLPFFSTAPHIALAFTLGLALLASACVGTLVAYSFTPSSDHPKIISSQVLAALVAISAVCLSGKVLSLIGLGI
eukprot:Hpha_TRINITY_DN14766_c1_g1::TRINITY_DN14766_c1_g1_i2::g.102390::m.102390